MNFTQTLDKLIDGWCERRAIRPLEVGDESRVPERIERVRKQALGIAYWYDELIESK